TPPGGSGAGIPLSPQPVVSILDAGGNLVTSAGDAVHIAIGTNPASGTLSGAATVSATAGIATFSGLSIDKAGAGYTIVATSGSLQAATSTAFAVSTGAPAALFFTTQPSGSTGGVALPTPPVVEARDAGGNVAATPSVNVSVALVGGGG